MEPTSHEADRIEKQATMWVKESKDNTKSYNFDEAIDLAGELNTQNTSILFYKVVGNFN